NPAKGAALHRIGATLCQNKAGIKTSDHRPERPVSDQAATWHLFIVTQFGNPDEGPDGDDTSYLVVARGINEALQMAEIELHWQREGRGGSVSRRADAVFWLGPADRYSPGQPRILMGPVLRTASFGTFPNWSGWVGSNPHRFKYKGDCFH